MNRAAGSSNGRTAAFEAVYLGSIPSPAALRRSKILLSNNLVVGLNSKSGNLFKVSLELYYNPQNDKNR